MGLAGRSGRDFTQALRELAAAIGRLAQELEPDAAAVGNSAG